MIVHSTRNNLDRTCLVQVEGIDPGMSEVGVRLFAQGAAGAHNPGWQIGPTKLTEWLEADGRPLPEGSDTTEATGARVLCSVEES